jgi:acyl-CoA thioester hydrolase
MTKIFHHNFIVSEDAIDGNGHVNNVEYVQWMQDIAILHSAHQGGTTEKYQNLGSSWIIRTHFIEYLSPAFVGDEIEALTWVSDMRRVSSLRKYQFRRASDQTLLAKAETRWVYVDSKTGRPIQIHPEIKSAFELVPIDQEPLGDVNNNGK